MNDFGASFSKDLKFQLSKYLLYKSIDPKVIHNHLELLEKFDLATLDNDHKQKAFWINIYNGLTNYFIIKNRIQKSVREKRDFFFGQFLKVGNFDFSLDDIEHGILRQNRERWNKPSHLNKNDPKIQFIIEDFDPRIHFALNCGSISCPALSSYSIKNLDKELENAKAEFLDQEFLINHEKKTIEYSPIFKWYQHDFPNEFLNDSRFKDYYFVEREYNWELGV